MRSSGGPVRLSGGPVCGGCVKRASISIYLGWIELSKILPRNILVEKSLLPVVGIEPRPPGGPEARPTSNVSAVTLVAGWAKAADLSPWGRSRVRFPVSSPSVNLLFQAFFGVVLVVVHR